MIIMVDMTVVWTLGQAGRQAVKPVQWLTRRIKMMMKRGWLARVFRLLSHSSVCLRVVALHPYHHVLGRAESENDMNLYSVGSASGLMVVLRVVLWAP